VSSTARFRNRKSGFSFAEVLTAVFIVALLSVMIAATMPAANTSRAKAAYINKAIGLAQKELESIRGQGYANATATQLSTFGLLDNATPTGTNLYSFTNSDNASNDNPAKVLPSGTGSVLLEQVNIDLRRVTVTVTWKERSKTRSVQLGTLLANL